MVYDNIVETWIARFCESVGITNCCCLNILPCWSETYLPCDKEGYFSHRSQGVEVSVLWDWNFCLHVKLFIIPIKWLIERSQGQRNVSSNMANMADPVWQHRSTAILSHVPNGRKRQLNSDSSKSRWKMNGIGVWWNGIPLPPPRSPRRFSFPEK